MKIRDTVLALGLMLTCVPAFADLVVVANPAVKFKSLHHNELTRLFLGLVSTFPDGSRAMPVDIQGDTRKQFYQVVLGRDPEQVEKYWVHRIFTSSQLPPRRVRLYRAKQIVARSEAAISYMDRADVDGSVKVIAIVADR